MQKKRKNVEEGPMAGEGLVGQQETCAHTAQTCKSPGGQTYRAGDRKLLLGVRSPSERFREWEQGSLWEFRGNIILNISLKRLTDHVEIRW